ncbi:hypothetical protein [Marinobacterium arenosum]|uniref:hypothetical protein n=1 Tax=Marinobacterium arenosum TaxID=2862496 RepID=UPI001C938AA3|nr:hypothetical protein [Marinobacterium arenosum]MBY4675496.1 hypothetical protein [Marinobacterium arenosum]
MNRRIFCAVWAVGLGPLLLAVLLYFLNLGPIQTKPQGQLLPPGQHLNSWQLVDESGESHLLNPKWRLLMTVPGVCDQRCDYWNHQLKQVYTALGKDRSRVEWYQVVGEPTGRQLGSEQLARLGAALWVVDPHGNLVLRYSLEQAPQDLLKDLRRLLKVSRIG